MFGLNAAEIAFIATTLLGVSWISFLFILTRNYVSQVDRHLTEMEARINLRFDHIEQRLRVLETGHASV